MTVIEPWAIASFPRQGTYHAELGSAKTSHVVAAFIELNHGLAAVASLPALLLCHLYKTVRLVVFGTFPPSVELGVAQHTHPGLATSTACIFSAVRQVHSYLPRFYPFATALIRAVKPISCSVLLIFLVPQFLELVVEESLDILQGDMFCSTTSWRHMLSVVDRESELASEAGVAHAVATPELGGFVDG